MPRKATSFSLLTCCASQKLLLFGNGGSAAEAAYQKTFVYLRLVK